MGANPHANGGLLIHDLMLPDFKKFAVNIPSPGMAQAADTQVLGEFLRDVVKLNAKQRNFRIFGPDETLSNRLNSVFEDHEQAVGGADRKKRRIPRGRRARNGDAERAPVRRVAGGLSFDRKARPF